MLQGEEEGMSFLSTFKIPETQTAKLISSIFMMVTANIPRNVLNLLQPERVSVRVAAAKAASAAAAAATSSSSSSSLSNSSASVKVKQETTSVQFKFEVERQPHPKNTTDRNGEGALMITKSDIPGFEVNMCVMTVHGESMYAKLKTFVTKNLLIPAQNGLLQASDCTFASVEDWNKTHFG